MVIHRACRAAAVVRMRDRLTALRDAGRAVWDAYAAFYRGDDTGRRLDEAVHELQDVLGVPRGEVPGRAVETVVEEMLAGHLRNPAGRRVKPPPRR